MPEDRNLSAETIRRIAREQAGLDLKDAEVDALKAVLEGIRGEIARLRVEDRPGLEPATRFELEGWPK